VDLDLFAKHREAVELAIRRTCARWHVTGPEAQELAAELWLCVLNDDCRVLRRFRGGSTMGTYLFRIMNRTAGHWIRRRRVQRRRELAAGEEGLDLAGGPDPARNPEVALADAEIAHRRMAALRAAWAKLPALERRVLRARSEGMRVSTIADRLGISFKSAENHLYRAIERVRRDVGGDGIGVNGHGGLTDRPACRRTDGRTDGRTD
jgi:RNA polymerase sigma factor (sigma-70 family)